MLLQDLCKRKAGWDETITTLEANQWQDWLSNLPSLSKIKIHRFFIPTVLNAIEIVKMQSFSDASQYTYGACCYLRVIRDGSSPV